MTDDTALADRLEARARYYLTHDEDRLLHDLAARRLRELGAEVERLNGEIAVLREAAGANNDPEFWLIRIRLGNDLLYEAEVKVEAAEARITELEAERAWRPMSDAPFGGQKPVRILIQFGDEGVAIAYGDEYYAEGGHGFTNGFAWVEPFSGDPLDLHFSTPPSGWQPLPTPPTERGTEEGG